MRRHLWDIARLGLVWMVIWGAAGAAVSLLALVTDPPVIGPGEGPLDMAWQVGMVGGVSGVLFGLALLVGERDSDLADVTLMRAGTLGIVAGAVLPLLSVVDADISNTAFLGGVAAVLSVLLARAAGRSHGWGVVFR